MATLWPPTGSDLGPRARDPIPGSCGRKALPLHVTRQPRLGMKQSQNVSCAFELNTAWIFRNPRPSGRNLPAVSVRRPSGRNIRFPIHHLLNFFRELGRIGRLDDHGRRITERFNGLPVEKSLPRDGAVGRKPGMKRPAQINGGRLAVGRAKEKWRYFTGNFPPESSRVCL